MKNIRREIYSSPQVEVMETNVQAVICQSGAPLNEYPGNSWDDQE